MTYRDAAIGRQKALGHRQKLPRESLSLSHGYWPGSTLTSDDGESSIAHVLLPLGR